MIATSLSGRVKSGVGDWRNGVGSTANQLFQVYLYVFQLVVWWVALHQNMHDYFTLIYFKLGTWIATFSRRASSAYGPSKVKFSRVDMDEILNTWNVLKDVPYNFMLGSQDADEFYVN